MKIRLIWDDCTPTRDRRPTTEEDIENDIHLIELESKEELLKNLLDLADYEEEDLEGGDIDEKISECLGALSDPGDGSPDILFLSIDGEILEDVLENVDGLTCSEQEVKDAQKEYLGDMPWENEDWDIEDFEEYFSKEESKPLKEKVLDYDENVFEDIFASIQEGANADIKDNIKKIFDKYNITLEHMTVDPTHIKVDWHLGKHTGSNDILLDKDLLRNSFIRFAEDIAHAINTGGKRDIKESKPLEEGIEDLEKQIEWCEKALSNPNGREAADAKANYGDNWKKEVKADLADFEKKLCNSGKGALKESLGTLKEKAVQLVREQIFGPLGIKEVDEPESLEQEDDDGNLWDNIVHYVSEEDFQKLLDDASKVEEMTSKLPAVGDYTTECGPFFELDRGLPILGRPAICFYSMYLEDIDESLKENKPLKEGRYADLEQKLAEKRSLLKELKVKLNNAPNAEAKEELEGSIDVCENDINNLEGELAEIRYIDNGDANDYSGYDGLTEAVEDDLEKEDGEEPEDLDYGHLAWMLNEIISSMNNEKAYYGTWLETWPDECSRAECYEYFGNKEGFEELRSVFDQIYKKYHKDGLYVMDNIFDRDLIEFAHWMDHRLGLKPIKIIEQPLVEDLKENLEDDLLDDLIHLDDLLEEKFVEEKVEKIPEWEERKNKVLEYYNEVKKWATDPKARTSCYCNIGIDTLNEWLGENNND